MQQISLPFLPVPRGAELNKVDDADMPAHRWYRFVLSYPPHLVRDYLKCFAIRPGQRVLDPFSGTGTTVVECKKLGIEGIGIEANPMAHFASKVKIDWNPNPEVLERNSADIGNRILARLAEQGIDDRTPTSPRDVERLIPALRKLPGEMADLLLTNSISPLPLHKTLMLLDEIMRSGQYRDHQMLALAKALTGPIGNLHFGPEVGVGPAKTDAAVVTFWMNGIRGICRDLEALGNNQTQSVVHHADSRAILPVIPEASIDAVITSPPYPNEKDYTRTTRLESVLLGFISSKDELRALKRSMVRSNTRGVYKGDDDDQWISGHAEIERIAAAIEARRIELNKTSGFERLYAKVTKLYFGGMARHLAEMRRILRPGACLAYVVGDQASYLRIMIRTGQILATIAKDLGYQVEGIDLFRTRLATATKEQLREEVVVLRWPGLK
ncbi:MAG TPA: DNA methyltransferase [Chthoniobacteraceae bacterium]|nr:DNA methyltransferase [Chthoniobacteraceae bacterium]